jgi:Tn3 transposase DDE domain
LGRVERTLFLLNYISSSEMRQNIQAQTTKVEAFTPELVALLSPTILLFTAPQAFFRPNRTISTPIRQGISPAVSDHASRGSAPHFGE